MFKDFQIRVVSNACITRVNHGEGTLDQVISSYPIQTDDQEKVLRYAYEQNPGLASGVQKKA